LKQASGVAVSGDFTTSTVVRPFGWRKNRLSWPMHRPQHDVEFAAVLVEEFRLR
jgi:hypothetical protein